MIRYTLKCDQGHSFDSWFASSDAFDTLHAAGHVACIECGSTDVSKSLMAPRVPAKSNTRDDAARPLATPSNPVQEAIEKMHAHLAENSTDVGRGFAKEARDQHLGDAPDRPIHGQASADEARALIEDGVPVLPIPGIPKSKAN
ncbi:MAG: DUF1178 family protein [Pseudomonadota bacterium]